jgi:hypothetical protein
MGQGGPDYPSSLPPSTATNWPNEMACKGRYASMFNAQAAQYTPAGTIPRPTYPTVAGPA